MPGGDWSSTKKRRRLRVERLPATVPLGVLVQPAQVLDEAVYDLHVARVDLGIGRGGGGGGVRQRSGLVHEDVVALVLVAVLPNASAVVVGGGGGRGRRPLGHLVGSGWRGRETNAPVAAAAMLIKMLQMRLHCSVAMSLSQQVLINGFLKVATRVYCLTGWTECQL